MTKATTAKSSHLFIHNIIIYLLYVHPLYDDKILYSYIIYIYVLYIICILSVSVLFPRLNDKRRWYTRAFYSENYYKCPLQCIQCVQKVCVARLIGTVYISDIMIRLTRWLNILPHECAAALCYYCQPILSVMVPRVSEHPVCNMQYNIIPAYYACVPTLYTPARCSLSSDKRRE